MSMVVQNRCLRRGCGGLWGERANLCEILSWWMGGIGHVCIMHSTFLINDSLWLMRCPSVLSLWSGSGSATAAPSLLMHADPLLVTKFARLLGKQGCCPSWKKKSENFFRWIIQFIWNLYHHSLHWPSNSCLVLSSSPMAMKHENDEMFFGICFFKTNI